MKRILLLVAAPLVTLVALVWAAWGPLLVTSEEEAVASVKGERITEFGERTVKEVIQAHESAVGRKGRWEVRDNEIYQSFFEGDEHGAAWIVTYDAPGTGEGRELTFLVKSFTGDISFQEPNWGFLGRDQSDEYPSAGPSGKN